jgi:alkanesulfonate monooxygenase SsuD/methylene tetrahydromethanopterin reductase-like flavin-dependent oxidoreductase (luciferase family)
VKVGIFDHVQKHDRPERTYAELYDQHIEIAEYADAVGMDFYFVAEHHFDLGYAECPSPSTFLGAVSQRTKNIRIGPLLYVLPLSHPVRIAEEVAMLDNLTKGRFECGIGSGAGSYAFEALNVPWQKKNEIMWEAFEVMKGVWSNPVFDYDGQYFKCKRVQLSIPLVQKPFPPFWLPTRSRESIELAVKHGMSTAQWCPPKPRLVRELFDHYREIYRQTKPIGPKPHIGFERQIYVAETDKTAVSEANDHWVYFWHRLGGGRAYGAYATNVESLAGYTRGDRLRELLDIECALKEKSFVCGSPQTVARQIKEIALEIGADCFLGEFTFGALEHEKVRKSLNLFVEHVMPELKAFEIDALNYPPDG